jgi:hypothetical protein
MRLQQPPVGPHHPARVSRANPAAKEGDIILDG